MQAVMIGMRDAGISDAALVNEWLSAATDVQTCLTMRYHADSALGSDLVMTLVRLLHAAEDEAEDEAAIVEGAA